MSKEYAVARPASMPNMSGAERWTIVGGPFVTMSAAVYVANRRPPLNGQPVTIIERDVTEWRKPTDPHPADSDLPTGQAGTSGAENHTNGGK